MESKVINMFAAKKVKLHGMKSAKWTTKDKIIQYRGLINLYTRDRKIIEVDTNVSKKRLQRELKDLQKKVYNDRRALDNAIRGDKQQLRNTLADHRELQLAYQNSQPKKVVEEIHQRNFNSRKILDKLKYDKKVKSQTLADLKLEQALLEDRLKYAFLGQIPQEKEAQIITGKVQDATLRKEAAWSIYHIYHEILDIMKRDALYFDVIIATVRSDGYSQSKCFLGATKLGQLATEYLDDRRQEYDTLEKIILKDLATRKTDIRVLNEQVENASASIKQLLRKESDITTCVLKLPETASLEQLNKDVTEVEETLQVLKNTTLVPSYEQIHPCLVEQKRQRKRLRLLAKKCEREKETMLNKVDHAGLMNTVLKSTVGENLVEYKATKHELVAAVEALMEKKSTCDKIILRKRKIAANIRISLRQLLQLSYDIKPREEMKKKSSAAGSSFFMTAAAVKQPPPSQQLSAKRELPEDEIEGTKILSIILPKFSNLMQTYFADKHNEERPDELYKQFESMMQERLILAKQVEQQISETSLLQGMYSEATHEFSRDDIKKQSAEIVAANTKNEDLVPMFALTRSRTKKFGAGKKKM